MSAEINREHHPCFNKNVKGVYGRVHLPVAPLCNIKCNYCNRKYDCVNESRPGVSSAVLKPRQALDYLEQVLEKHPNISVAGIAGPGDAFADADATLETMRLIRERYPHMLLCLATNGLNLPPYVQELAQLKVSHVTVTVNAVDPDVGAKIYAWVRDGKVILRGRKAAELLLERQLEGIRALKEHGITVKVNTIVIPGINDEHVMDVAAKMKELGVDILNCMKMYPNEDTPFGDIPEPTDEHIAALQKEAGTLLPQMTHCTRCRADAVGLLDDDRSDELGGCLAACSKKHPFDVAGKPYVAVATLEGMLVNQHLGHAQSFQIWGPKDGGFELVEERAAPPAGHGGRRWLDLVETLRDCRAVLANRMGETPRQFLLESEILPVEMSGFISTGLQTIYNGGNVSALKTRRKAVAGGGECCSGGGEGCG